MQSMVNMIGDDTSAPRRVSGFSIDSLLGRRGNVDLPRDDSSSPVVSPALGTCYSDKELPYLSHVLNHGARVNNDGCVSCQDEYSDSDRQIYLQSKHLHYQSKLPSSSSPSSSSSLFLPYTDGRLLNEKCFGTFSGMSPYGAADYHHIGTPNKEDPALSYNPLWMTGFREGNNPYWPLRLNPSLNLPGLNVTADSSFLLPHFRKPKRIRTAFSPSQLLRLEHAFEKNHYVVGQERKDLALSLGLTETQIKVWFQNRRTKFKRMKAEDEMTRSLTEKFNENNQNSDKNHMIISQWCDDKEDDSTDVETDLDV